MRHVLLFGVLALVAACAVRAEVKPAPSDDDSASDCAGNAPRCSDGRTLVACSGEKEASFSCPGPGGCVASAANEATCDFAGSLAGDPCPTALIAAYATCDGTGRALMTCVGDKWKAEPCPVACAVVEGKGQCVDRAPDGDAGDSADSSADGG